MDFDAFRTLQIVPVYYYIMFDIGIICVSLKASFDLRTVWCIFSVGLQCIFHCAIIRYFKFVTHKYLLVTLLFIFIRQEGSKQHKEQT